MSKRIVLTTIENFSDEELRVELNRRKKIELTSELELLREQYQFVLDNVDLFLKITKHAYENCKDDYPLINMNHCTRCYLQYIKDTGYNDSMVAEIKFVYREDDNLINQIESLT